MPKGMTSEDVMMDFDGTFSKRTFRNMVNNMVDIRLKEILSKYEDDGFEFEGITV